MAVASTAAMTAAAPLLLLLLASTSAAPTSPCLPDPCDRGDCIPTPPTSDNNTADAFTCKCEAGFGGPLCQKIVYEEHACDTTEDEHARFGCRSCPEHLGIFYKIHDTDALSTLLRSPLGQQRVRWMLEDWPAAFFGGKQTSFGLLMLPRLARQESGAGEEERFCLSMLPDGLSVTEHKSATLTMWGVDMEAATRLPDGFGPEPLEGFEAGDFVVPLRFAVGAAAGEEEEAPITTAPEEEEEEDVGVEKDARARATVFARAGPFLDTLASPERGLSNIFLPSLKLGGQVMNDTYLKQFWLGAGIHTPPGVNFGTIGNSMCSQCASEGKGAMDLAADLMKGVPALGALVPLLSAAQVRYVSVHADNGNRVPISTLAALGLGSNCEFSPVSGMACLASTTSPSPLPTRAMDAEGSSGGALETRIRDLLDSYQASRLTYDLQVDMVMAAPEGGLGLDALFAGRSSAAGVDDISVRFEVVNLFNKMDADRDYCASSVTPPGAEPGTRFDYEPPRERTVNMELAFSWNLGSMPLELAFTRASNWRSERSCNGTVLESIEAQPSEEADSPWRIIARFPRITPMQIVCMANGIEPSVSPDESERCEDIFADAMEFVPTGIAKTLSTMVLDQPEATAGPQGTPLSLDGDHLGPRVSITLDGPDPRDWMHQFQGTVSLFGVPQVNLDMKFARGANSADAVSQAAAATAPTLAHGLPASRRRRRSVDSPSLLMGLEFRANLMGFKSLIQKLVKSDFVSSALENFIGDTEAGIALVLSSQTVNTIATPSIGLNLKTLEGMPVIPEGASVIADIRLRQPCRDVVCKFILRHVGDVKRRAWINLEPSGARMVMGVSLDNIVMKRDSCPGASGSIYAQGRPVIELSSVGMYMLAEESNRRMGFTAYLTIDIGNLRGGDNCAYEPTPGENYRFLEPLTFRVTIDGEEDGLYIAGAMIGVWTRAMGMDMLHFGNLQLGGSIGGGTVPKMEAGGELVLGKDCFVRDEAAGGLVANANASCVAASVYFGVNPSRVVGGTYLSAGFMGLTLKTIITVFAPASAEERLLSNLPEVVLKSGFSRQLADDGSIVANPEFSYASSPFGATTLTNKQIPSGLFFHGLLNLLGFEVAADIIINPTQQIKLNCSIDPLSIGGGLLAVQRSATNGQLGPVVDIDVQFGELSAIPSAKVLMQGYVTLLGFSAEAEISVDDSGYHMFLEQRFLNLYQSSLWVDASYGSIKTASFAVRGEMKDDFSGALEGSIQEVLTAVAGEAGQAIEVAQAAVDSAKAEAAAAGARFTQLKEQLLAAANKVQAAGVAFDVASSAVQKAKDVVSEKQAKVKAAANDVGNKEAAVRNAQAKLSTATAAVASKKAAMDNAQAKFDSATAAAKAAQAKMNSAEASFNAWVRNVDSKKAAVDRAQSSVNSAQAVVESKTAAVDSAKSAVTSAKNTLRSKTRAFEVAEHELNDASGKCKDLSKEVEKVCDCGRICWRNWKGKKKCKCANPLRGRCGSAKSNANSLCGAIKDLSNAVPPAREAMLAAETVLRAAETSLDGANEALTVASNGLILAQSAMDVATKALSAAEASKAAAKALFDAAAKALTAANQGVEAAKGALTVAKAALSAAENVAKAATTSLNAAKAALEAAEETLKVANSALAAAKLSLAAAQEVADSKKAILAGLQKAQATVTSNLDWAAAALEAAQNAVASKTDILEGVKEAVQVGSQVGAAVARFRVDGVIKVVKTTWAASLSVAAGGAFAVRVTVSILGAHEETFAIHVDFNNLFSAATALVDKAFDKASSLLV